MPNITTNQLKMYKHYDGYSNSENKDPNNNRLSKKRTSVTFSPKLDIHTVPSSPKSAKNRQNPDYKKRRLLDAAANNRYKEGSIQQKIAIDIALKSILTNDETVHMQKFYTLENNLTQPHAKSEYKKMLRNNQNLWAHSIFWNPQKGLIEGINLHLDTNPIWQPPLL
jgi:hypothetical protein